MKRSIEEIMAQMRTDFFTFYCTEGDFMGMGDKIYKGRQVHATCVADGEEVFAFFDTYIRALLDENERPPV